MEKETLDQLYDLIQERRNADPESSYVSRMFLAGKNKMAQKLGEEATEVVVAALREGERQVIVESADMIFHWVLLLSEQGIKPEQVMAELKKRMNRPTTDSDAAQKAIKKEA